MKGYNVVVYVLIFLGAFAIGMMLFNDSSAEQLYLLNPDGSIVVEKKLVLEQIARDMTDVKVLVKALFLQVTAILVIIIISAIVGFAGSMWILSKKD